MNKYTNPFKALEEAKTELKSLGADPLAPIPSTSGATNPNASGVAYPFPWGYSYGQPKPTATDESQELEWYYDILSLAANRVYTGGDFYIVVDVHMGLEGFERVCALLRANTEDGPKIQERHHSEDYDMLYFEPSPLLKLFALVPVEQDKEVTCGCDCGTQN